MPESSWGARDARGEWQPDALPQPSPLFQWPWRPVKVFKYLFGFVGFLWPYNLCVALLAAASWAFFTPSMATTATFKLDWIGMLYLRNAGLIVLTSSIFHLRLYTAKAQGLAYKYTDKWLATDDGRFLFKNQLWDNVFWSLGSGAIIWTAYEALTLWAYSNRLIPFVDWRARPAYFVLMMVGVVFLRQIHFFFIHWASHWKPLFKISHYLHHKNINIGPWSGLSMHPIEHLLYFSGVLLHWIIPSHPMHAMFHLMHAGVTPALGHTGFHAFKIFGGRYMSGDNYFHYLHHRYFTANYGVPDVPLDYWFGTWHDGTPESHARMMARRKHAPDKGAGGGPA